MTQQTPEPNLSFWSRLPSIVWIPLIVGGIAALIGGIVGLFYGLSHIEGFASILMLVVAWSLIRLAASPDTVDTPDTSGGGKGLVVAIAITFFALMGMAIDQPGNVIYNQPVEWLFCPSGSDLQRGITVSHPLPERTDVTQDFSCVDTVNGQREIVDRPTVFEVIAVRFVEYVVIGYALIALSRVYSGLRRALVPKRV
jgi:hypothetical protein